MKVRSLGRGHVRRPALASFAATVLVVALAVPAGAAAVPVIQADFAGTATGAVVHVDLLQTGNTRVADVEEAFSGATVASKGLANAPVLNEMQRVIQPARPGKNAYARGSGIDLGIAISPPSAEQTILAAKAESDATPNTDLVTRQVGPIAANPVAWASALRGQAFSKFQGECVIGSDLSRGLGYAADAQLLGTTANPDGSMQNPIVAADAPTPDRAVAQSTSRNVMVRQLRKDGSVAGGDFGLMAEVRQTIAPVTILKGTPNQTTIEFAGEWVLQAVAGGLPGTSFVWYGPGSVSPSTPVLRLINAAGQVTQQLTTQQIPVLGPTGLVVTLPSGLGEIVIGEDPRAIGGDATSAPTESANGTLTSAAVDVVRIKLVEQKDANGNVTNRAADIRVGHMEVSARVPEGGIACSIPVAKVANPDNVTVGQSFTTTITVRNPFDCELLNVKVVDDITTVGQARFKVTGTVPTADTVPAGENLSSGQVVWNNVGTIPVGGTKDVAVTLLSQGGAGRINDTATATATIGNCTGVGAAQATVAGQATAITGAGVTGVGSITVPVTAVLGERLPRTGSGAPAVVVAGLSLMALAGLGWRGARAR